MLFFGHPAILVAVYGSNFRILQTIKAYQKYTQQGKLVRNYFEIGQGSLWFRSVSPTCDFHISYGTVNPARCTSLINALFGTILRSDRNTIRRNHVDSIEINTFYVDLC